MMPTPTKPFGETVWTLPPLILHPFNEKVAPSTLLENSKAALMLSGLIPGDGSDEDQLRRRLLSGRYAEVRMLFFVGKDVLRWIEQCLEWIASEPNLVNRDIRRQSFAGLLTSPPENVKQKLTRWGVADYAAIFSRAIGLNAMFAQPPAFDILEAEFLRNYHRYADALYGCYMESEPHCTVVSRNFGFELYASGEYSRLLESEWEQQ